ncbi:MAG: hypothetical protein Ct9H90mP3_6100 [Flammeovirgaceae bacterium]|nr:MAG: hypothetical protein Ct9H90mP3_6100 [Flammeovirgaceae bacterium]
MRALQPKEKLNNLLDKIQSENFSKKNSVPILIKIAPDLSKKEMMIYYQDIKNKIDGIIATNTTISRVSIDNNEAGGLSGKPLSKIK